MSQPPPPPGTPPEFGKSDGAVPPPPGPPQAPPPGGGYGYPGQPAPAPQTPPPGGYGYPAPQTPPASPAGPNPYAQPVQPGQNPYAQAPTQAAFPSPQTPPPGPYGAPTQQYPGQPPYGQVPPQGYGYPQPQYGQGGPAGPGGGRSNNKLIGIIAAGVAAVLLIGVGVFFATKGSDGGDDPGPGPKPTAQPHKPTAAPHSDTLKFGWDVPADMVAKKDNLKRVFGIWFTDKLVVKQQIDKVVGYDLTTGQEAWTLPAPSKEGCAATKDSYQNTAAIQFGDTCDQIVVFDLTTGAKKWTKVLPGDDRDFDYTSMAISGDTLGVDWMSGSIGYRLSNQAVLWQSGNGNCEDDGYAGGAQFVAIVNCDFKTYKVQAIDPDQNGKPKWTWTAQQGFEVRAIVSTDPVVVVLEPQDGVNGPTDVVAIGPDGKMQSRISLGTDKYDISIGENGAGDVHNALVSKDTVYLTLRGQSDSNGQVLSGIVAFNIADGKQKWVAKPKDKQAVTALAFLDDGKILGVEPPDYDIDGKLVSLDPATGAISDYASFGEGAHDQLDVMGMENDLYWHKGHVVLASHTIYEGNHEKYLVDFH